MATFKQKIIPHLWFDREAKKAADFYVSVFPESKIIHMNTLRDTPSGDCDVVSFELLGQGFMAISAGPLFQLNPSVSFFVSRSTKEEIDQLWNQLSDGGRVLMPLDTYPFSERYGWVQDKYGVSWQLILPGMEGDPRPSIVPSLLFVGKNCGKAEEAVSFYLSVFKNTTAGIIARYGSEQSPDKEGTVMYSDFMIENQWFAAMDSALEHGFQFNEGISLMISCETQKEIDEYWDKLSAVPEAEQCGWLKDQYGLSWQVVPSALDEMMKQGTPEQVARVTQAFLKMKKFNLAELQNAYEGK